MESPAFVMMRNMAVGVVAAAALALVAADASIAGVAAWKIVLAGVGFALFVLGGRTRNRAP